MVSSKKRIVPVILSFFIIGFGQAYEGRIWAGIWFFIIGYAPALILKIIWKGVNPGFWFILAAWIILWLYNLIDAWKGPNYAVPPCAKACPAGLAPWIYINQIAHRHTWVYPFVPFFKTLGLICPAPCEDRCTRRGVDEPIAIRELKNEVHIEKPSVSLIKRPEKIAVVGAGPCGLTLAYALAQKGYALTVYEKEKQAGGVLTSLIPEFRLPKPVLHSEIQDLLKPGYEIKYGTILGKDLQLQDLLNDHDYVFLALGAWLPVTLGIPGEDMGLVGIDLLRRIKSGEKFEIGRVAVIGGGNTAFDVARCLRRMGNEVKIYYRRRIEDMPAEHENRIEAQEEGIEIIPLTTPVAIVKNSVIMAHTQCFGGRTGKLEIIPNSEFDIKTDRAVIAIGQKPDTKFLADLIAVDHLDRITVKKGRTTHPSIYAGGDVVWGAKTLAQAVGDGLTAAEQIDYRIRGILRPWQFLYRDQFFPKNLKRLKFMKETRLQISHRAVSQRIKDFNLTEIPARADQYSAEAKRCLVCPLKYR